MVHHVSLHVMIMQIVIYFWRILSGVLCKGRCVRWQQSDIWWVHEVNGQHSSGDASVGTHYYYYYY